MNKKHIAILGAAVVGAGALILMSQEEPTYQAGGFAGGGSKKEDATVTGTETVTETPASPGDTIYNIVFPDPGFPSIPEAPITEPWWVTSLDPPAVPAASAAPTIKEERFIKSYPSLEKKATAVETIRERFKRDTVASSKKVTIPLTYIAGFPIYGGR